MATAETTRPQVYTIHGPHGLSAARFLRERAITLSAGDILIIAEHDEATDLWLECAPGISSAAHASRRRDPAGPPVDAGPGLLPTGK